MQYWSFLLHHYNIFFCTPQIFCTAVFHAFLPLSSVSLLIFDEVHHVQSRKGKHPYSLIMKEYLFQLNQQHQKQQEASSSSSSSSDSSSSSSSSSPLFSFASESSPSSSSSSSFTPPVDSVLRKAKLPQIFALTASPVDRSRSELQRVACFISALIIAQEVKELEEATHCQCCTATNWHEVELFAPSPKARVEFHWETWKDAAIAVSSKDFSLSSASCCFDRPSFSFSRCCCSSTSPLPLPDPTTFSPILAPDRFQIVSASMYQYIASSLGPWCSYMLLKIAQRIQADLARSCGLLPPSESSYTNPSSASSSSSVRVNSRTYIYSNRFLSSLSLTCIEVAKSCPFLPMLLPSPDPRDHLHPPSDHHDSDSATLPPLLPHPPLPPVVVVDDSEIIIEEQESDRSGSSSPPIRSLPSFCCPKHPPDATPRLAALAHLLLSYKERSLTHPSDFSSIVFVDRRGEARVLAAYLNCHPALAAPDAENPHATGFLRCAALTGLWFVFCSHFCLSWFSRFCERGKDVFRESAKNELVHVGSSMISHALRFVLLCFLPVSFPSGMALRLNEYCRPLLACWREREIQRSFLQLETLASSLLFLLSFPASFLWA